MVHVLKLRRLLESTPFTQQALARYVGVSFPSLNAWVNGRAQPRRSACEAIDEAYAEAAIGSPYCADAFFEGTVDPVPELSEEELDELLVGRGNPDVIAILQELEYRRVLGHLTSIVVALPDRSISKSVVLLDAAKEIDPDVCREVLTYPPVAMWAAACMRTAFGVSGDIPIEQHIAHFASIVGVAAHRAGVDDFSIEIPVRNGFAVLPSLGRLTVPEASHLDVVTLVGAQGRLRVVTPSEEVELPEDLASGTHLWEPIRSLTIENSGLRLHVSIDDIDPYRIQDDILPPSISARRLDQIDIKSWIEQLSDAWAILTEDHREQAAGIAAALKVIVPVENPVLHTSSYLREGFGAILSSLGMSSSWIAGGLLEEFSRMKVNALNFANALHTSTMDAVGYLAPFYTHPVPFGRLLETFHAFRVTADFWGARYRSALGAEAFEAAVNCQLRHQWEESLYYQLVDSDELTTLGLRMLAVTHERGPKFAGRIPATVVDFARNITIDLRLCTRLTNVASDDEDVARLASAWMSGASCPVNKPVAQRLLDMPNSLVTGRSARRLLGGLKINHPERFEELSDNEYYLQLVVPGATLADVFAIGGRYEEAFDLYCEAIAVDAGDFEAWAGLAVACAQSCREAVISLGRFPELVFAVHSYLVQQHERFEHPMHLAKWLEPLLVRMDDDSVDGNDYKFGGLRLAQ